MDMEGMGPAQATEMTPSRAQKMMKLMTVILSNLFFLIFEFI